MTKLPRGLSGKVVVTALERTGFYFKRQKGSHIVMRIETHLLPRWLFPITKA